MALSVSLPALRESLRAMDAAEAIDLSDWDEANEVVKYSDCATTVEELIKLAECINGMINDKAFENWTEGEAFVKDVLG